MSANGSCWHKADIDLLELVRLAPKADMARAIDCLAPTVDAHRSTGYLHRDPQKPYSQTIHASSLFLDSQISTSGRLIFVTHRNDIPAIPARRGRQPVALVGGVG